MEDITQGVSRARAWPRARGKAKTAAAQKRLDNFRIAQEAANYVAPQMMGDLIRATHGTPLLPRDILTSLLFNRLFSFQIDGGRVVKPMSAYKDVQDGLDLITTTEGQILVREKNGWAGRAQSDAGQLKDLGAFDFDPTQPSITVEGLGGYNFLWGMAFFLRGTATGTLSLQVRDSGTGNWLTGSNDYWTLNSAGATTLRNRFELATGTGTGSLSAGFSVANTNRIQWPMFYFPQRQLTGFVNNLTGPIDAVRVYRGNPTQPSGTLANGLFTLAGG